MRHPARFLPLLAVALLAGCSSLPYEKAGSSLTGTTGYSDYPLEKDTYYVAFRGAGSGRLPAKEWKNIEDFALLRAAEVTLAAKHTHFQIISSEHAYAESDDIVRRRREHPGGFYYPSLPEPRRVRRVDSGPYVVMRIRTGDSPFVGPKAYEAAPTVASLKKQYDIE